MDFRLLHTRLVSHVRYRVRNGEISERGLARLTGISQPHIHNVLKGVRLLSTDMADRIAHRLRIDLADLLTASEAGAPPVPKAVSPDGRKPADAGACRPVAMLAGWIGQQHPYPQAVGAELYPFPASDVDCLESPVAARLAPDPLRAAIYGGRGVVLMDRAEKVRREPDDESYFALDLSGAGTVGLVRRAKRHLYVRALHGHAWQFIPLAERAAIDVIQGRVSLLVRHL
jgi:transcriptional regulator with XRE-family HTH domain